jgi:alkylation response protein AidB-like acyl-CoA dehydrogenase
MDFTFSAEDEDFRAAARDWLADNVPRERRPLRGPAVRAFDLAWQRTKHASGYGAVSWPVECGGAGLGPVRQMIWYEECARAGAPSVGILSIALGHAGPTIVALGDAWQKATFLAPILRGEAVWCQGFSEPGAGSDLAGIRTRAVVDGDHLVINGQKIWTSQAQFADWQELLVRTDPDLPRHKGLTWVVCDMRTPGITVRPIETIAGEQHFCEVFYDDVRVPLANVVGGLNGGWRVAMSTLASERGAAAASRIFDLCRLVERLVTMARERTGPDGRTLIADDEIATRLAVHRAEAAALRSLGYVMISSGSDGAPGRDPGSLAALLFLHFGELVQRVRETATTILGSGALSLSGEDGAIVRGFLADRMHVIAGGTAEIRRNIIAERVLGLPRGDRA